MTHLTIELGAEKQKIITSASKKKLRDNKKYKIVLLFTFPLHLNQQMTYRKNGVFQVIRSQ